MFPYPEPLSDEQRQTLQELVPPVEKFFQEVPADAIRLVLISLCNIRV